MEPIQNLKTIISLYRDEGHILQENEKDFVFTDSLHPHEKWAVFDKEYSEANYASFPEGSIFVTKSGASSRVSQAYPSLIFLKSDELNTNPLAHSLVPPHVMLSEPSSRAIVAKYGRLPEISRTDIILRLLGYVQRGRVICVRRRISEVSYYDVFKVIV